MFLKRLELTNFRNYEHLELELTHNLNILAGQNAQGKTNILEAILFMALSKSPRTAHDSELVRWDQPWSRVRGDVQRRAREGVSIDITLWPNGRKTVKVNEVTRRRLADVIGQVNVVMFGPQDLNLVSGEPALRRRFLNAAIAQTSREYYHNLAQYRKALLQRNRLLKSLMGKPVPPGVLEVWDEQLAHYGARLMEARIRVVAQLSEQAQEMHHKLAGGRERMTMAYQPSFDLDGATAAESLGEVLGRVLEQRRAEELRRGLTLVGPHRDDLELRINGQFARVYGSQGQQRTATLSLKLAELGFVRQWIGETPILLLDDVMSELDDRRREQVLALTDDVEQILITCSQPRTFSDAILRRAGLYQVQDGQVEPIVTNGGEETG